VEHPQDRKETLGIDRTPRLGEADVGRLCDGGARNDLFTVVVDSLREQEKSVC
jgi:hypothetical protein